MNLCVCVGSLVVLNEIVNFLTHNKIENYSVFVIPAQAKTKHHSNQIPNTETFQTRSVRRVPKRKRGRRTSACFAVAIATQFCGRINSNEHSKAYYEMVVLPLTRNMPTPI